MTSSMESSTSTARSAPKNPAYAELVRERFASVKPMELIGATLGTIEPGLVEIHAPCTEKIMSAAFVNYVHGGVLGMLADSAMGLSALTMAEPGALGVTVEYKINMLTVASGDEVIASARTIRAGKRVTVVAVEVFSVTNGARKLVATGLGTLIPTGFVG